MGEKIICCALREGDKLWKLYMMKGEVISLNTIYLFIFTIFFFISIFFFSAVVMFNKITVTQQ